MTSSRLAPRSSIPPFLLPRSLPGDTVLRVARAHCRGKKRVQTAMPCQPRPDLNRAPAAAAGPARGVQTGGCKVPTAGGQSAVHAHSQPPGHKSPRAPRSGSRVPWQGRRRRRGRGLAAPLQLHQCFSLRPLPAAQPGARGRRAVPTPGFPEPSREVARGRAGATQEPLPTWAAGSTAGPSPLPPAARTLPTRGPPVSGGPPPSLRAPHIPGGPRPPGPAQCTPGPPLRRGHLPRRLAGRRGCCCSCGGGRREAAGAERGAGGGTGHGVRPRPRWPRCASLRARRAAAPPLRRRGAQAGRCSRSCPAPTPYRLFLPECSDGGPP